MQQGIRRLVATGATATVGAGAVMVSLRTSGTESYRTSQELLQFVGELFPTPVEVDAAELISITDHPDNLKYFLPDYNSYSENELNLILSGVKAIFKSFIQSAHNNIHHAHTLQGGIYDRSIPVEQWAMLKSDFPCCDICHDLLAAPTILNCSHSFCGSCLNDMIGSCVLASGDQQQQSCEIVSHCPKCRVEITNKTYEYQLDLCIQRRVDALPDCVAKRQWKERRWKFLKSHYWGVGIQYGKRFWETWRNFSPPPENPYWKVKRIAIPILTFAVLALICACRKK